MPRRIVSIRLRSECSEFMLGITVFMMWEGGRLELTGVKNQSVEKVRKRMKLQVEDTWVTAARD